MPKAPQDWSRSQSHQCKREALEILHHEALKAFAGGSKAAQDFLDAYKSEQENA